MKSKFLYLCLSFLMALGIWIYVITVVSPESQHTFDNVSVQLQSQALLEERGLVITSISHTSVSLQLFGNRTDLVQINSGNIQVFADVSKIYEPGVHDVAYTVSYPGSIPNSALEIQSRSPGVIQVTVEKKITKKLDISVEYQGVIDDGYLTDDANIQLSPKYVNVSVPQSLYDTVKGAKIIVDLTNRTETISENFAVLLYDTNGNPIVDETVSCDTMNIHLDLKISQYKQVPILFDPLYVSGATKENTTIKPNVEYVRIEGHKNLLANIDSIDLGTIDLSRYPTDSTVRIPLDLPDGVTAIGYVEFDIKFTGLATKQLTVSNFVPINVPDGMVPNIDDKEITVTIRGTQEELDRIKESDITVMVDFSGARVGQLSTRPVQIKIDAELQTNAGAVVTQSGDYSVKAKMQRA